MNVRKSVSLATLVICVYFLVNYIMRHLSDFRGLSEVSASYVFLIGALWVVILAVNGLFLKALTVDFGINLSIHESFSLSVITTFGNIFLPMRGGAGFRAVYLKSRYDFDYSFFLSSLAGNYLIVFNATSIVALIGMAVLYVCRGEINYPAVCAFAAFFVLTSWAILFPPASLNWIPFKWAREPLNRLLSGWLRIRNSRKTVSNLLGLTFLYLFLASLTTWLEFTAFHMKDASGNAIGFFQSSIYTAVAVLSLLVSITPSALGIREGLLMVSSQFLGISPSQALAVSLLDRTISSVVLALLACYAFIHIKKQLRSTPISAANDDAPLSAVDG